MTAKEETRRATFDPVDTTTKSTRNSFARTHFRVVPNRPLPILPASMAPSPKLESSSFLSDDNSTPPSLLLSKKRATLSFRRNRRLSIFLSFPVSLLLIYLFLPSWLNRSDLFVPPPAYISHAGKSALETTIILPKVQYKFRKGEGADIERREKVKEAILRTWELYSQEAWGWDEVRPVQGGGRDSRFLLFAVLHFPP